MYFCKIMFGLLLEISFSLVITKKKLRGIE